MTIDSQDTQETPLDPKSWRPMTKEERYRIIEGLFVLYPRLNHLWTLFDQHIQALHEPESSEFSSCLAIIGVAGIGKTQLVESWLHTFCVQKAFNNDQEKCPFSYVSFCVPVPASNRNLFSAALHAVGDAHPFTGPTPDMPFRFATHLENLKPNVLIIDEANHLVDAQTGRVRRNAVEGLEVLVKCVKTPIILIGIEEKMQKIIETSLSLERRIDLQHLTPFTWDEADPQTIQEFRSLLDAFDQALPFDRSGFSEKTLAFSFFTATHGILGWLLVLLRTAAVQAIEASEDGISVQRLANAYATRLASSSIGRDQKNPFEPSA